MDYGKMLKGPAPTSRDFQAAIAALEAEAAEVESLMLAARERRRAALLDGLDHALLDEIDLELTRLYRRQDRAELLVVALNERFNLDALIHAEVTAAENKRWGMPTKQPAPAAAREEPHLCDWETMWSGAQSYRRTHGVVELCQCRSCGARQRTVPAFLDLPRQAWEETWLKGGELSPPAQRILR